MIEFWVIGGLFLYLGLVGCVSFFAARGGQVGLKQRVLSLEYDVAELNNRLIREVKSRASSLGVKAKQDTADLLDQIKNEKPKESQPWWMDLVHPDLKH